MYVESFDFDRKVIDELPYGRLTVLKETDDVSSIRIFKFSRYRYVVH